MSRREFPLLDVPTFDVDIEEGEHDCTRVHDMGADPEKTPIDSAKHECPVCHARVPYVWQWDHYRVARHYEHIHTESMGDMPGEECPGTFHIIGRALEVA